MGEYGANRVPYLEPGFLLLSMYAFLMPYEMTPAPTEEKEAKPQPSDDALRVIRAAIELNASQVSKDVEAEKLYEAIKNDRPIKLTAEQAHFERGKAHDGAACHLCWHYFTPSAKARKSEQEGACEVVRPGDGNDSVNKNDYCHFAYSPDGVEFPLRGKTDEDDKPEAKPADNKDSGKKPQDETEENEEAST